MKLISIIVPVLNEAERLPAILQELQSLRDRCELILVDGGSIDGSVDRVFERVDKLLHSQPGRAVQMNVGAQAAEGHVLLFLHADTQLPENVVQSILQAIAAGHVWGRFDVAFDANQAHFKLIAGMMNWRSRLTGISTGDQAIFVRRDDFMAVGGFPEIALMEDIALSRRLKVLGKPGCLSCRVVTSARRWQQNGVLTTIFLMWYLRLAYCFGRNPDDLARTYYRRS